MIGDWSARRRDPFTFCSVALVWVSALGRVRGGRISATQSETDYVRIASIVGFCPSPELVYFLIALVIIATVVPLIGFRG